MGYQIMCMSSLKFNLNIQLVLVELLNSLLFALHHTAALTLKANKLMVNKISKKAYIIENVQLECDNI